MEFIALTISAQTLNTIGAGLQELPFKIANPAIAEVDAQVRAHLAKKGKKDEGSVPGAPPSGPATSGEVPSGGLPNADIPDGKQSDRVA